MFTRNIITQALFHILLVLNIIKETIYIYAKFKELLHFGVNEDDTRNCPTHRMVQRSLKLKGLNNIRKVYILSRIADSQLKCHFSLQHGMSSIKTYTTEVPLILKKRRKLGKVTYNLFACLVTWHILVHRCFCGQFRNCINLMEV